MSKTYVALSAGAAATLLAAISLYIYLGGEVQGVNDGLDTRLCYQQLEREPRLRDRLAQSGITEAAFCACHASRAPAMVARRLEQLGANTSQSRIDRVTHAANADAALTCQLELE